MYILVEQSEPLLLTSPVYTWIDAEPTVDEPSAAVVDTETNPFFFFFPKFARVLEAPGGSQTRPRARARKATGGQEVG
jgi:hypothetical protein